MIRKLVCNLYEECVKVIGRTWEELQFRCILNVATIHFKFNNKQFKPQPLNMADNKKHSWTKEEDNTIKDCLRQKKKPKYIQDLHFPKLSVGQVRSRCNKLKRDMFPKFPSMNSGPSKGK